MMPQIPDGAWPLLTAIAAGAMTWAAKHYIESSRRGMLAAGAETKLEEHYLTAHQQLLERYQKQVELLQARIDRLEEKIVALQNENTRLRIDLDRFNGKEN